MRTNPQCVSEQTLSVPDDREALPGTRRACRRLCRVSDAGLDDNRIDASVGEAGASGATGTGGTAGSQSRRSRQSPRCDRRTQSFNRAREQTF